MSTYVYVYSIIQYHIIIHPQIGLVGALLTEQVASDPMRLEKTGLAC